MTLPEVLVPDESVARPISGRLLPVPASWRSAAVRFAPLGLLAMATAAVAVRDPHRPGSWAMCPTLAIFGIDCPGCGSLRALHDATRGHVTEAISHNALVLPAALFITYATVRRPGPRWSLAWAVAFVVFTVVRNLPGSPLASGT